MKTEQLTIDLAAMTIDQLNSLSEQVAAEIARRQPAEQIKVALPISSYNERRDGKPWIATVIGWGSASPAVEFGTYIGDSSGGELIATVKAGSVIRFGRKGGYSEYAIISANGIHPASEVVARKAFLGESVKLPPTIETAKLGARI